MPFPPTVLSRLVPASNSTQQVEFDGPLGGIRAGGTDELRHNLRELGIAERIEIEENDKEEAG